MSSYESSGKKRDNIQTRGMYQSSPLGTSLFVGLRAADPFLQYALLAQNLAGPLLERLGTSALPAGPPAVTGFQLLDRLDLSPYRMVLLIMSIGSAAKQSYHLTRVSNEPMPANSAVVISLINSLINSLNSLAFICAATTPSINGDHLKQTPLICGVALYAFGLLLETYGEIERRNFKRKPGNKGKVCNTGLWANARHINYGGYTLWRTGYAITGGGLAWGAVTAAFFAYDFLTRGVPVLDQYCQQRYGKQWTEYKEKVTYVLLPYLY